MANRKDHTKSRITLPLEVILKRMLAKRVIDPETGCWLWTGARSNHGYPIAWGGNGLVGAHRLALWIYKGIDIDVSADACHTCDNPPCFNPDHLFSGTRSENMKDAWSKGRMKTETKGEKNGNAKITEQVAMQMKREIAAGTPYGEIAKAHGVGYWLVANIANGKSWKDIEPAEDH